MENNLKHVKDILGVPYNEDCKLGVKCTPAQARQLLQFNTNNRPIDRAEVEKHKRTFERGDWKSDSVWIGFSPTTGELTDGQHRLTAVAESNIEYAVLKFDFTVEKHEDQDSGKKRTYANHMSMFDNTDAISTDEKAMFNSGININRGTTYKIANSEASKLGILFKEELEACRNNKLFKLPQGIGAATVKSSLFWAYMHNVPMWVLKQVAEVLRTGISTSDFDAPIIRLRDILLGMQGGGSDVQKRRAAYTQECIYAVLHRSTSKRLPREPELHYQDFDMVKEIEKRMQKLK